MLEQNDFLQWRIKSLLLNQPLEFVLKEDAGKYKRINKTPEIQSSSKKFDNITSPALADIIVMSHDDLMMVNIQ
jgi:hypothetical protein